MTGIIGYHVGEAVRVRVEIFPYTEMKKFSVDPEITSFEMLQSLLAKIFDIEGEFMVTYLQRNRRGSPLYVTLSSDWDLDAAIQAASQPFLHLRVEKIPKEKELEDWDIIAPIDVPSPTSDDLLTRPSFADAIITQINEYPEFLKGVERENVQHIKIMSKEADRQTDEEDIPVINRSVSQMSNLSYHENPGSPCSSRSAEGSSTSEPSPDEKAKKWKWTRFLTFLLSTKKKSCGLQTVIEDVDDNDIPQKVSLVDSEISAAKRSKKSFIRKLLLFSRYKSRCEVKAETPPPVDEDLVGNVFKRQSLSIYPENIRRPESVAHPFLFSGGHDVTLRLSSPTPSSERHGRSLTALGNYGDHKLIANKQNKQIRSLWDEREINPIFITGNTKNTPKQPTELDLYILTTQSAIFRHLVAAWNRILVRLTLRLENEQIYQNSNSTREYVEQILLEVYRKLNFITEDDVVQLRTSLDSLQNELSKSSLARKLFWKDPHLFPTIVDRLQNLINAVTPMPNPTIGAMMDRLKLGISMVTVLTTVLQEAQILPDRTRHLTIKTAQRSRELLTTLISEPDMLDKCRDVTLNIVASHEQLLSKEWERMPEAPLIRSMIELTNVCTAALYQFVQLVYQENELTTNQKTYGISWLVRILSDQQNLDKFLCRMVCQILLLAIPSNNTTLTPSEAVLLHQQLAVLLTLVKYSPSVADHLHLNYAEEFRYYIFSHVISQKVPNEYAVRPNILALVEDVRHQILDVKVSTLNSHLITAL